MSVFMPAGSQSSTTTAEIFSSSGDNNLSLTDAGMDANHGKRFDVSDVATKFSKTTNMQALDSIDSSDRGFGVPGAVAKERSQSATNVLSLTDLDSAEAPFAGTLLGAVSVARSPRRRGATFESALLDKNKRRLNAQSAMSTSTSTTSRPRGRLIRFSDSPVSTDNGSKQAVVCEDGRNSGIEKNIGDVGVASLLDASSISAEGGSFVSSGLDASGFAQNRSVLSALRQARNVGSHLGTFTDTSRISPSTPQTPMSTHRRHRSAVDGQSFAEASLGSLSFASHPDGPGESSVLLSAAESSIPASAPNFSLLQLSQPFGRPRSPSLPPMSRQRQQVMPSSPQATKTMRRSPFYPSDEYGGPAAQYRESSGNSEGHCSGSSSEDSWDSCSSSDSCADSVIYYDDGEDIPSEDVRKLARTSLESPSPRYGFDRKGRHVAARSPQARDRNRGSQAGAPAATTLVGAATIHHMSTQTHATTAVSQVVAARQLFGDEEDDADIDICNEPEQNAAAVADVSASASVQSSRKRKATERQRGHVRSRSEFHDHQPHHHHHAHHRGTIHASMIASRGELPTNPFLSILRNPSAAQTSKISSLSSRMGSEFIEVAELGSGAFGVVHQVRHVLDGCVYAIKTSRQRIINPIAGMGPSLTAQVGAAIRAELEGQSIDRLPGRLTSRGKLALREMYGLAQLPSNPHLVRYHTSWIDESDGRLRIQMEFCNSGTLATHAANDMGSSVAWSEENLCEILRQLCSGLAALHAAGFTHADIKPENIFVSLIQLAEPRSDAQARCPHCRHSFVYKLGDFGLLTNEFSPRLDASSVSVPPGLPSSALYSYEEGDCRYLAREVLLAETGGMSDDRSEKSSVQSASGANTVVHFHRADVFALGMSIIELARRRRLPPNGDAWRRLREVSEDTIHYLDQELPDGYSPAFRALLCKMIDRDPLRRPRAAELLRDEPLLQTACENQRRCDEQELHAARAKIQELTAHLSFVEAQNHAIAGEHAQRLERIESFMGGFQFHADGRQE